MIDELITYCYSIGATEISFHIAHTSDSHEISLNSNFDLDTPPNMKILEKHLNCGRQPDIEESYWTLTGISDLEDEVQLQVIGAMVDKTDLSVKDNILYMHLTRYKSNHK